jgi:hypothetical protein
MSYIAKASIMAAMVEVTQDQGKQGMRLWRGLDAKLWAADMTACQVHAGRSISAGSFSRVASR